MDALAGQIRDGVYPPGSALPSRHELMERYDVSRATVDKIISLLIEQGVLTSLRGSGTYVSEKGTVGPHIFVVLNNELECDEAAQYHHQLGLMLAEISSRYSHTLMSSREFLSHVPAISRNEQARVIWSRPSLRCWTAIHDLEKASVPQILVNRVCPDFNYVATDTWGGVKAALRQASTLWGDRVAVATIRAHPGEPFIQEREAAVLEACAQQRLRPVAYFRSPTRKSADLSELAARLSAAASHGDFDYVIVVEHALASVISGAGGGASYPMITVDWKGSAGQKIVSLHQGWEEMFRQAVAWAVEAKPQRCQHLVLPRIE
ncbi:MAG: putative HTH-type transcriptional regulator YurK [Verrucomicrobiota bacterium]